jgi:anti-anti-sigma factor
MGIEYRQLENGIRLIRLSERLDIDGTLKIGPRLTEYINGNGLLIIFDLENVDFLASIGIRMLVTTAKSIFSHSGKVVILNPLPNVREVLEITGITQAIPICRELEEAINHLKL